MTQSEAIILALKAQLKAQGLTYAEFAQKVNLSEVSIKRIFSHKSSISLDRLEHFCTALETELLSLLEKTKLSTNNKRSHLTRQQENVLNDNPKLLVFFYALLKGLSPERTVEKYKITAKEAERFLFSLDRLGLIRLDLGGRFKMLASPFVEWSETGPLNKKYAAGLCRDFLDFSVLGQDEYFLFRKAYLARGSLKQIRRQLGEVLAKIKEYSEFDQSTQPGKCFSTTFVFAARDWIPTLMKEHLRNH